MVAAQDGEARFRAWTADAADRVVPPGDLSGLLRLNDRFLLSVHDDRALTLMAGCTAAVLDGGRVRGAHAAPGSRGLAFEQASGLVAREGGQVTQAPE